MDDILKLQGNSFKKNGKMLHEFMLFRSMKEWKMSFTESFTSAFLVLLIVSLVVSSIGFYKYVYFISLGYGFSIAVMGGAMLVLDYGSLTPGTAALYLLFILYGCRLGGYLLVREIHSASYRSTMKREIKDGKSVKMIAKFSIWISCALLYTLQVSPVFVRLQNGGGTDVWCLAGAAVMACGIGLEAAADWQKSKAKKENPKRFCGKGLYRIVRCPNYFGEVLFWTGVFLSGVNVLSGPWQWAVAVIGYVCIVYIMFGGAKRLELRQNRNYGEELEYRAYVQKTPILIPFVPLYSVAKYKWLVG